MSRGLNPVLALRGLGVAALLLLLWNPQWLAGRREHAPPLVLLDASLSLAGRGGRWREALDSARRVAQGGVIWRFGDEVAAFDTTPPGAGASRLRPALEAAAARGGPVVLVTDGEIGDVASLPSDLRARPRTILMPRARFADAWVAAVRGQRRLAFTDTLRLSVTLGASGMPANGERGAGSGTLVATTGSRRLAGRAVSLPDSGTIAVELAIPASLLPEGAAALEVALQEMGDDEPRDDARLFVVEAAPRPAVVVVADPPDWELRFLAQALADVVRSPVRSFARLERGGPWRDAATLRPVGGAEVTRAVGAARLVVHRAGFTDANVARRPARLVVDAPAPDGDWYVAPPLPSPLAAVLAGIAWDSLPPLTGAAAGRADTAETVVLAAALARRGRAVPAVTLRAASGSRVATFTATGFWRWAFRGGYSEQAYRALVAGVADWLLEGGAGSGERFVPDPPETPLGLPTSWRWTGSEAPGDVALRFAGAGGEHVDTLRFDAAGRATLRLGPGVYRYATVGGGERGVVAVEAYSDEWPPRAPTVAPQPGTPAGEAGRRGLRETWWLFVMAIAAFAAEWVLRRREGLP